MANNRSIKKRQYLVLYHLFNEVYNEPIIPVKGRPIDGKIKRASIEDYYRLVSKDKDADGEDLGYGSGPLPEYIRFNDVVGILYKVNSMIDRWKTRNPSVIAAGISAGDLKTIEYSTLFKELNNLTDRDHVLVKTDGKNIKRKSFYFPNESIEGYDSLLDYLLQLPYDPNDDFGIACRELAFSNYSKVVLNREFIIQNMRRKKMRVRFVENNYDEYPYLGHFKKVFERPEPIVKLASMCSELEGMLNDQKDALEIVREVRELAETYLERIDRIQEKLSSAEPSDDQLSRLHPKDWFILDPDAQLRREAQWDILSLSEDDLKVLLSHYARYHKKEISEIDREEWSAFVHEYISRVEMDVIYALSMISNSYWALMYFHLYSADNFYRIMKDGIDPYERLPGPSVANKTGNWGRDDAFWDRQLYRYAMYDYSLGTNTDDPNGPALMGIGPAEYEGKIIPTTFSFRITPHCFLTASGALANDYGSKDPLNTMYSTNDREVIEKKVYGQYTGQSYLHSMFSGKVPKDGVGETLRRIMLDIDPDGNCKHDSEHYLQSNLCNVK